MTKSALEGIDIWVKPDSGGGRRWAVCEGGGGSGREERPLIRRRGLYTSGVPVFDKNEGQFREKLRVNTH